MTGSHKERARLRDSVPLWHLLHLRPLRSPSHPGPASIVVEINGVAVGGSSVFPSESPASGGSWVQYARIWNSGADGSAAIEPFDSNTATSFNDFALDDISLVHATGTIGAPAMSAGRVVLLALVLVLIQWYRTRGLVSSR